jgi:hypothetical protein
MEARDGSNIFLNKSSPLGMLIFSLVDMLHASPLAFFNSVFLLFIIFSLVDILWLHMCHVFISRLVNIIERHTGALSAFLLLAPVSFLVEAPCQLSCCWNLSAFLLRHPVSFLVVEAPCQLSCG